MSYTPSEPVGGNFQPSASTFGPGSQALSLYEHFQLQELIHYIERNNNTGIGLGTLLQALGNTRGVYAPTTGHYEAGRRKEHLIVGNIVAPAAGAGDNMVVALSPNSMTTRNGIFRSYPRANDVYETLSGAEFFVVSKNTAVNPHQITIRPRLATVDLNNEITVGQPYKYNFTAHVEGDGAPKERERLFIKYENTFQIIKEAFGATGSNLTNAVRYLPGEQPKYVIDKADAYINHEDQVESVLLYGKKADNIAYQPEGLDYTVSDPGTQGLIDFIETYGFNINNNAPLYSIQDFDNITNLLVRETINFSEFLCLMGINIYQGYENVLVDYTQMKDGITLGMQDGSGDIHIEVGAKTVKKGAHTYMFKLLHTFSDNRAGGTQGYGYPDTMLVIPNGMTQNYATNQSTPTVMMEYKELQGYKRYGVVSGIDGTGYTQPTNSLVDVQRNCLFSEVALHASAGNNMLIVRPV